MLWRNLSEIFRRQHPLEDGFKILTNPYHHIQEIWKVTSKYGFTVPHLPGRLLTEGCTQHGSGCYRNWCHLASTVQPFLYDEFLLKLASVVWPARGSEVVTLILKKIFVWFKQNRQKSVKRCASPSCNCGGPGEERCDGCRWCTKPGNQTNRVRRRMLHARCHWGCNELGLWVEICTVFGGTAGFKV